MSRIWSREYHANARPLAYHVGKRFDSPHRYRRRNPDALVSFRRCARNTWRTELARLFRCTVAKRDRTRRSRRKFESGDDELATRIRPSERRTLQPENG